MKYNLLDNNKKNSQLYLIAQIFTDNIEKWIGKRYIEKQYCIRWMFKNIKDNDINNCSKVDDILNLNNLVNAPGDLQRNLRTFYDKFKHYGLKKKEKNNQDNKEIEYMWEPIEYDINKTINIVARNIFKKKEDVENFKILKNNKCEICGCDDKNTRFAIDHWRSHSIYNIDDINIAVLLCEKCNNIHHNYDASKIIKHYHNNVTIINNWINKEIEICEKGFLPNEKDKKMQIEIINQIKEENEIFKSNNFWKNLDK